MTTEKIVLQKGESIKFLDYTIKNSLNNDGLVLFKDGANRYESHLGNYGKGTQKNIDYCKKDAVIYFMIARPQIFATSLVNKIRKANSGTYHEYYSFLNACKNENIEMPAEVTCGGDINCMIYFNDEPLTSIPKEEPTSNTVIENASPILDLDTAEAISRLVEVKGFDYTKMFCQIHHPKLLIGKGSNHIWFKDKNNIDRRLAITYLK